MDGQDPMMGGNPNMGEQPPMDGQDPMMGGDPNMGEQPPMDGQDPNMGEQPPMDGQDPNMGEQPPMDGNNDDSTISIINQLSDEDREAVRAYAESMLDTSIEQESTPEQSMMESIVFTKKQLNKLFENFGPTEDEIQRNKKNKPLNQKKERTVSSKSPFNSPRFK
jgi:hypothetical protein